MNQRLLLALLVALIVGWLGWSGLDSRSDRGVSAPPTSQVSRFSGVVIGAASSIELTRFEDRENLTLVMQKLRPFGSLNGPLHAEIQAPKFLGMGEHARFAVMQRRSGTWRDAQGIALLRAALAALRSDASAPVRSALNPLTTSTEAGGQPVFDPRWLGDADRLALVAYEGNGPSASLKWLQPLQRFSELVAHPVGGSLAIKLTPISVRHGAFNFLKPDAELAKFRRPTGRWLLRVEAPLKLEDLASLPLPVGWHLELDK